MTILIGGLGLLLLARPAMAAFKDPGYAARPIGLAGAFSAISDDASAPLYNPAGITQLTWNELTATYARLFTGLTLYAGADTTHLATSYVSFVSRPIQQWGSIGISWANFMTSQLYREDTARMTYAKNLGDFFPSLNGHLSFGMNVKYLRRTVTLDIRTARDPVFANGHISDAMSLDAGVLFKNDGDFLRGLRLAAVVKDVNEPDVGFKEIDRVPRELRLGFALQNRMIVPALDAAFRGREQNLHGGLETWLFNKHLGLRAGGNRSQAAAGLSYFQAFNHRFGFRFDYGFTMPFFVEDTTGSHRLALTVYF